MHIEKTRINGCYTIPNVVKHKNKSNIIYEYIKEYALTGIFVK